MVNPKCNRCIRTASSIARLTHSDRPAAPDSGSRDFRYGPCSLRSRLAERTTWRLTNPLWPFVLGDRDSSRGPAPLIAQVPRASRHCLRASETLPPRQHTCCQQGAVRSITAVPCEPLDACDVLPEQGSCQVAFGQLEDEVPGVPNEAPAGLEQALLQARQRPVLRQNLISLSGRRPMRSRQAKERLGDRRPEGGQQCGSVEPPPKDARLLWGGAASSLTGGRPDRGEPIELDQAARRT